MAYKKFKDYFNEKTEVTEIPTGGKILVQTGNVEPEKIDPFKYVEDKLDKGGYVGTAQDLQNSISGAVSGFQGSLLIADTPTLDGSYTPLEEGTYPNAGNLVYSPSTTDEGFDVKFINNGGIWTKSRVDIGVDGQEDFFLLADNLLTTKEARFNEGAAGSIGSPNWTLVSGTGSISIVDDRLQISTNAGEFLDASIRRLRLIDANVEYYVYIRARLVSGTSTKLQIGGFSSQLGNGHILIEPKNQWQTFTGKLTSTVNTFFGVGSLIGTSTTAVYQFDDIILSTEPIPDKLLVPNVQGYTQEGLNLKVLSVIIRPSFPDGAVGGEEITWTNIEGQGAHESLLVTNIDSSELGTSLKIDYPEALNVLNMHITTDETFAKYGIVAGASVGTSTATMQAWVRSNVGSIQSWDAANNVLGSGVGTVTADNCIKIITTNISVGGIVAESLKPDIDSSATRLDYAGSNAYIVRPYAITTESGAKKFKVYNLTDGTEVTLSTLTSSDKFYLTGGIASQIIPLSVVSTNADIRNMQSIIFAPGCNFWITGLFQY